MTSIFIPVITILLVVSSIVGIIIYFRNRVSNSAPKKKDKKTLLKEANRKLAHNPRDPSALLILADIHYNENNHEKAMQTYKILLDLCATNKNLDQALINFRFGMCAYYMNNIETAYKSLLFTWSTEKDNYVLNSTLGKIEYKLKKFDKAAALLKKCFEMKPNDLDSRKYLGLSFFKMKDFKRALPHLAKVTEADYNDKETLFIYAKCCSKANQSDKALKIFSGLRQDATWGAKASLFAGTINSSKRSYDDAIVDFEVGLKAANITTEEKVELHYRLALVYSKQNNHEQAIAHLKRVSTLQPDYKDVTTLLSRLRELSTNRNLGIYLGAQTNDFIELCKKIVSAIFPKSSIKVVDIVSHQSSYIEILAEVKNRKWEDIILFKFMREEGNVGELVVRELYARLKDTRAGRGFCCTVGTFSEGAESFVEARLIDLVDKNKLLKFLKKIS